MKLRRGQLVLERYRIGQLIRRGKVGRVYRGHTSQTVTPVAVKILPGGSKNVRAAKRFSRRAELLTRIRQMPAYVHTPAVMLTALGDDENIVRAFEIGADDYIEKPFSIRQVCARVRRLVRKRGQGSR